MKADRDAADDAQAPRELPLVDPAPRGAPQRGPQRQRRLEGRESHEAPARGQGGVADRFLGHLFLTLFPAGPSSCPRSLRPGRLQRSPPSRKSSLLLSRVDTLGCLRAALGHGALLPAYGSLPAWPTARKGLRS